MGLLVELFGTTYDGGVFDDKKTLLAYWGVQVCKVWLREHATQWLRSDITIVGKGPGTGVGASAGIIRDSFGADRRREASSKTNSKGSD